VSPLIKVNQNGGMSHIENRSRPPISSHIHQSSTTATNQSRSPMHILENQDIPSTARDAVKHSQQSTSRQMPSYGNSKYKSSRRKEAAKAASIPMQTQLLMPEESYDQADQNDYKIESPSQLQTPIATTATQPSNQTEQRVCNGKAPKYHGRYFEDENMSPIAFALQRAALAAADPDIMQLKECQNAQQKAKTKLLMREAQESARVERDNSSHKTVSPGQCSSAPIRKVRPNQQCGNIALAPKVNTSSHMPTHQGQRTTAPIREVKPNQQGGNIAPAPKLSHPTQQVPQQPAQSERDTSSRIPIHQGQRTTAPIRKVKQNQQGGNIAPAPKFSHPTQQVPQPPAHIDRETSSHTPNHQSQRTTSPIRKVRPSQQGGNIAPALNSGFRAPTQHIAQPHSSLHTIETIKDSYSFFSAVSGMV
jgi:hypothetical protein